MIRDQIIADLTLLAAKAVHMQPEILSETRDWQTFADLDAVLLFNPALNRERIMQFLNENIKPDLHVTLSALPE
jgi:hypothetical protein